MRSEREIVDMVKKLEDDIQEHGWDVSVDAASRTLRWVFDELWRWSPSRLTERPDVERRREWIARGGDPAAWPTKEEDDVS